jgi:hypothetical protein
MTRGLGKAQRLILDTLAAIESERGPGGCRRSDLLKEAYRRSSLLQAKEAARKTAKEESRERMPAAVIRCGDARVADWEKAALIRRELEQLTTARG